MLWTTRLQRLFTKKKKKDFLSICAIVKDEAQYLPEWVAYHRAIGVDHFYIYNNDSTDSTQKILDFLAEEGICTPVEWPRSKHPSNPQVPAYRHAVECFGPKTEWMATIDLDEYIVPLRLTDLQQTIKTFFTNESSILCNWLMFGSAGLQKNDGSGCIERFLLRSDGDNPINRNMKSIFRPATVDEAFVHNHYLKEGHSPVLSDGSPHSPPRDQLSARPVYGHIRINHYYCKSLEEYMLKRAKGIADCPPDHPLRSMEHFERADRNEFRDERALDILKRSEGAIRRLEMRIKDAVAKSGSQSG